MEVKTKPSLGGLLSENDLRIRRCVSVITAVSNSSNKFDLSPAVNAFYPKRNCTDELDINGSI